MFGKYSLLLRGWEFKWLMTVWFLCQKVQRHRGGEGPAVKLLTLSLNYFAIIVWPMYNPRRVVEAGLRFSFVIPRSLSVALLPSGSSSSCSLLCSVFYFLNRSSLGVDINIFRSVLVTDLFKGPMSEIANLYHPNLPRYSFTSFPLPIDPAKGILFWSLPDRWERRATMITNNPLVYWSIVG